MLQNWKTEKGKAAAGPSVEDAEAVANEGMWTRTRFAFNQFVVCLLLVPAVVVTHLFIPTLAHTMAFHIVTAFTGILCVFVGLFLVDRARYNARLLQHPHVPSGFFWGLLGDLRKHHHEIHDYRTRLHAEYGRTVALKPALFSASGVVSTTDPQNVEHILRGNFNNYVKPPLFRRNFLDLLGEGIFRLNHSYTPDGGKVWKMQRKLAARIFTQYNFTIFFSNTFTQHGELFCNKLSQVEKGTTVDVQDLFFKYTMEAFGHIGFGIELNCLDGEEVEYGTAFDGANQNTTIRFTTPWWRWLGWIMPKEIALRKYMKVLDRFARKVIKMRRSESAEELRGRNDLLSLFLRHETATKGEQFSEEFLRDLVLNFMVAGRDTTACTLSFIIYMLSQETVVEERLVAEIDRVLQGEAPTTETVAPRNMPYLDGVVNEALRLYPPVPGDVKYAVRDDRLPSGYFVPAGTSVRFLPYVMGRDPETWEDPLRVVPERWFHDKNGTQEPINISKFKFPVFQAGPRICLGMNMVYLEAKILTCMILQRFRLKVAEGQKIVPNRALTLSVLGGVHAYVTPRASGEA